MKISNKLTKRQGISFLTIIATMIIVMALIMVSMPLITQAVKKIDLNNSQNNANSLKNHYICYKVYDAGTNSFKLHEAQLSVDDNGSVNVDIDDTEVASCTFHVPSADTFKLSLIGGGGGGAGSYGVLSDTAENIYGAESSLQYDFGDTNATVDLSDATLKNKGLYNFKENILGAIKAYLAITISGAAARNGTYIKDDTITIPGQKGSTSTFKFNIIPEDGFQLTYTSGAAKMGTTAATKHKAADGELILKNISGTTLETGMAYGGRAPICKTVNTTTGARSNCEVYSTENCLETSYRSYCRYETVDINRVNDGMSEAATISLFNDKGHGLNSIVTSTAANLSAIQYLKHSVNNHDEETSNDTATPIAGAAPVVSYNGTQIDTLKFTKKIYVIRSIYPKEAAMPGTAKVVNLAVLTNAGSITIPANWVGDGGNAVTACDAVATCAGRNGGATQFITNINGTQQVYTATGGTGGTVERNTQLTETNVQPLPGQAPVFAFPSIFNKIINDKNYITQKNCAVGAQDSTLWGSSACSDNFYANNNDSDHLYAEYAGQQQLIDGSGIPVPTISRFNDGRGGRGAGGAIIISW